MDPVTIQSGLASVQSAIDIVRGISSVSGAIEKAELRLRLAEVMSALADAKIALADGGTQIAELQRRVERRVELAALRKLFLNGVYVILDENNKAIDGPFCSRCLDIDDLLVRPAHDRSGERGMGYCPQCKNKYPLWTAEGRLARDGAEVSAA